MLVEEIFKKAVSGYHAVNVSPIKEAVWEEVNSCIFENSGIEIYSKSDGSHISGCDIVCSLGRISNKSSKYNNKDMFNISSYRLTSTCTDKNPNCSDSINSEITRRNNFDYYSIICRKENIDSIVYDWIILPSDHKTVSHQQRKWLPVFGKRGNKSGEQVGWYNNNMSIKFSMSSQLWISINKKDIKDYIIASTTLVKKLPYNYIQINDMLNL
jgi:hypothetical protein